MGTGRVRARKDYHIHLDTSISENQRFWEILLGFYNCVHNTKTKDKEKCVVYYESLKGEVCLFATGFFCLL